MEIRGQAEVPSSLRNMNHGGNPYSQLGKSLPLYIPKLEPSHEGMIAQCCGACFFTWETRISIHSTTNANSPFEKLLHAPPIHI